MFDKTNCAITKRYPNISAPYKSHATAETGSATESPQDWLTLYQQNGTLHLTLTEASQWQRASQNYKHLIHMPNYKHKCTWQLTADVDNTDFDVDKHQQKYND